MLTAVASGRVNLIGDHTDYTGGLVMPMVLSESTIIRGTAQSDLVWDLISADDPTPAHIRLPVTDPACITPPWARYVAGVIAVFQEKGFVVPGFSGTVETTIPIGSGLSSSAALEVAVARIITQLINNQSITAVDLARMCQRAEHIATGVPCGIMDQLSIVAGRPQTATLIDCHDLHIEYVDIPNEIEFSVQFIHHRTLADSAYSKRVAQCQAIEAEIGPLRLATVDDLSAISSFTSAPSSESDQLVRRARHVITENQRVRDFAQALHTGDFEQAGRLMTESHWSLSQDYETSTPAMDEAVNENLATPGVLGARMTGGGFGGCIVVLRSR
jgi:galactokinase